MSGGDTSQECPSCKYSLVNGQCPNLDCPAKLKVQIHVLLKRYLSQVQDPDTIAKVDAVDQCVQKLGES